MKTWFISDTHFGHANCLTFKQDDGSLMRTFDSVEDMDNTMVENWNSVVADEDKVYHLGDVVMHKRCLSIMNRLKGRKTLIAGNHDIFNTKEYKKYFENIRAYKHFPAQGIIMSHIPVHPCQLASRFKWNIHGHMHRNHLEDERYINICVENINYTPISFDQILEMIKWENPQHASHQTRTMASRA